MKKTAIILVFVLCAIAGSFFLYKKDDQKSHAAHTVTLHARPYQPLDGIRKYFGIIEWAGTVPIGTFVRYRFGDDVLGNLERIRFDTPGSSEYEDDPTVQYYHPKGGGAYGARVLPVETLSKEVHSEAKIYYTFGNRSKTSLDDIRQKWQKRGIENEQSMEYILNSTVTAVVTHIREEMCPNAEIHPVSNLPWPMRPKEGEVIRFSSMGICYQHPDGWFYFIFPAYSPSFRDGIQYEKSLKSFGEEK